MIVTTTLDAMKLKHWIRFFLFHDTTWQGQFAALGPLLARVSPHERIVVDVGANDGFYSSISYPFIKRGWRAVLIEPNPTICARAALLHSENERVTVVNRACGDSSCETELILFEGDEGGSLAMLDFCDRRSCADRPMCGSVQIKVERAKDVLESAQVPRQFGLLSIDTEGHDFQVIRGLDLEHFRPRVIITENCPNNDSKFKHLKQQNYRLAQKLEHETIWTAQSGT